MWLAANRSFEVLWFIVNIASRAEAPNEMVARSNAPVIVLIYDRHRRPELPKRTVIVTLVGWVTLGAMVLGSGWNVRPVVTTLLVLPGVNYLLLEAVGLTPKAAAASSPLP